MNTLNTAKALNTAKLSASPWMHPKTVYAHKFVQYMHTSLLPWFDCDLLVDLHAYTGYYAAGSIQAEAIDAAFLSISEHT